MSENPILISNINDFIFCPVSIYFHELDSSTDRLTLQSQYQLNGTAAHEKSDNGTYSYRKDILQAEDIYCEKYNLIGKIDTFDCSCGRLTERKKRIITIYDGYVFQLYAQYFSLIEMGYDVRELRLYSMDNNKVYNIPLPENDPQMHDKFENTLKAMEVFDMNSFHQSNSCKCSNCIYEQMCSYSAL